jgi:DNA-binding MarR family transcriptional regulator
MPRTNPTQTALKFGVLSTLVGFHLRRAQLNVYEDFMRRAPVKRLTPGQLAILVFIDGNPALTQQRLCDGIRVEKSTLVVRLHRLAERGLIKRVRSTEDRRQNCLELTARGKKTLTDMMRFVAEHERRIAANLSPNERKQLIRSLALLGGQPT